MDKTMFERLEAHPFLRGLAREHLETLVNFAMEVKYQPNEVIFKEGDPANRFYLIENGRVAIESGHGAYGTLLIQELHKGDVLGWSWLYPPYKWSFDAKAIDETTAIFLYGTRIIETCDNNPALGYELMKRMAPTIINRLQATRRQLLEARGIA